MSELAYTVRAQRRFGDRLGILALAGSLLMTFTSFVAMVLCATLDMPTGAALAILVIGTFWVAGEHLLWLYGLVLVTRRGPWGKVGVLGWLTRIAAIGNFLCIMGVAGCFLWATAESGFEALIVALFITVGVGIFRLAGITGGGIALLRWAAVTRRTWPWRVVLGVLLAYAFLACGLLLAFLLNFASIRGADSLLGITEIILCAAAVLGMPVTSAILVWLYFLSPDTLEGTPDHAFPVELQAAQPQPLNLTP